MRAPVNTYETEIRVGLAVIVVMLLLLNISSTFVLHRVKRRLAEDMDQRLGQALTYASLYLIKNDTDLLPGEQKRYIAQRFRVTDISVIPFGQYIGTVPPSGLLKGIIPETMQSPGDEAINGLLAGQQLFGSDETGRHRVALGTARTVFGKTFLIAAGAESWELNIISDATKVTFYLAIGVIFLIIPMTLFLPRFILRPFKKMREAARSAGHFNESGGDEVAEVTRSYEEIIGELKRSEAELRCLYRETSNKADRLEKFNRNILKSIGSGFIAVDLSGKVIGFNKAAGDILGYDIRTIMNMHYAVAFPDEMEINLMIEGALERGEMGGRREVELNRTDGRELWLGLESSYILDDNSRSVGVGILLNDLTEIKHLQEELEINRQMAALGEMTGGLAHQLRNSMAAVSGFSQLMQRKTEPGTDLREIADSIKGEAATSEQMVRRFLNFARPLDINTEIFDLIEVCDSCARKCRPIAAENDIDILLRHGSEPCHITGDPLLLKETISNLIDNAIQAIESNGMVEIRIASDEDSATVTLTDDGPGIPREIRDKIFTPFYSSKPSGTGLGLALARKVINLHKGTISFHPGTPGGTECRIRLPKIRNTSDVENQPKAAYKKQ